MNKIVYDPEAKRYFAMMHSDPSTFQDVWEKVVGQAQRQNFGGVQGRLAIVDSPEVQQFLILNFHPQPYQYIWIGLRYWCGLHRATWVDGRTLQPGSFQAWDKVWNQDPTAACVKSLDSKANLEDWGPVAYSPQHTWIVKGQHKGYEWYYIEFPTGHP